MNLAKLAEIGIKATVTQAGKLHLVAPKGVITPELRQEIAQNRDFLLAEVNLVNMVNIKSYCVDSPVRHIPAANDVHQQDAANDAKAVEPKRLFRPRAPWLSPSEQVAADAYHAHHFACAQCQAGGRGYSQRCSAGAGLWNQYQVAAA